MLTTDLQYRQERAVTLAKAWAVVEQAQAAGRFPLKAMDRDRADARARKNSAMLRQVMSGIAEDRADTEPGAEAFTRRLWQA